MMRSASTFACLAAAATLLSGAASAQTLRVGLQEDPDLLDPALARSFVGRIVFTQLCDKLVDITPALEFAPQLATEWRWSEDNKSLTMKLRSGVVFHDGEPFNAQAVKYNLDRNLTLKGSTRRSEIAAIDKVEVVDDQTVRIDLKQPFAPLLAALSDRAGMMISPKAGEAAGENFSRSPVCSGPYKFVERIAQDRIVLEKFPQHWNAGAYTFEKLVFLPIPDTTVRLANLQAGQLDLIERMAPSDVPTVKGSANLKFVQTTNLGYQGITINIGNGPRADNPLAKDARIREALELSIDRAVINQVAFDGLFIPGNQPVAPDSPFYAKSVPTPPRDVARAKQLLKEAGHERLRVELMTPNNTDFLRVAEIIQALAGEAGFEIAINATEFASALDRQTKGDFEAFLIGWSGRADPDGNIHIFVACGGGLNDGKYCNPEVDKHLNAARSVNDPKARLAEYEKAAQLYLADRQRIYLYHQTWLWAHTDKLSGFKPHPDGLLRLENVSLAK